MILISFTAPYHICANIFRNYMFLHSENIMLGEGTRKIRVDSIKFSMFPKLFSNAPQGMDQYWLKTHEIDRPKQTQNAFQHSLQQKLQSASEAFKNI